MKNIILEGHVIDMLRTIPDNYVHCAITSPPYFGLRDYSTELVVWGGDEHCDHLWEGRTDDGLTPNMLNIGSFCHRCKAWTGELGHEPTPELFIEHLVLVFRELHRVLHPSGTCWLNLGSSYNGSGGAGGDYTHGGLREGQPKYKGRNVTTLKPKDLIPIPWMAAMALQQDGWYLRSDIIWQKSNPMPESVQDRPTNSHEYIFLLTKSRKYFYDQDAIREPIKTESIARLARGRSDNTKYTPGAPGQPPHSEHAKRNNATTFKRENSKRQQSIPNQSVETHRPDRKHPEFHPAGRNKRSVWTLPTSQYKGAHFATFPTKLVEPCLLAGTSAKGCCPECRAPWERVTEKTPGKSKATPKTIAAHEARGGSGEPTGTVGKSGGSRIDGTVKTIGWQPTCNHDLPPIPCLVLDPFLGSGTVAIVAKNHGRDWLGIDLDPSAIDQAEDRINQAQPSLFTHETIKVDYS